MNAVRGFFSGVFSFLLFDVLVLLGLIITLNLTILNPDFVVSEFDKLDIYSMVMDQMKTKLPAQEFIDAETVDNILADLNPWLEQQANTVIHGVYAYFKGEQALNVTVSLEPVRSVMKENAREVVLKSSPPQLQGATQSQIDAYMAQVYSQIDKTIPASFSLNESSAGSQVVAQLQQIKQIIGYIGTAYRWLLGLAVALVLLMALVHWWQPKPITRSVGIVFIIAGVSCTLGSLLNFLISQALSRLASQPDIVSGLQTKLSQLAMDIMAPLRMYGIAFLAAGIALIVISVLFRPPGASPDVRSAY